MILRPTISGVPAGTSVGKPRRQSELSNKRRATIVAGVSGLMLIGLAASATAQVRTFDFTATDFFGLPPYNGTLPYKSVSGSVIVQFDPIGKPIVDSITGIILTSLSIQLGSPISFDYNPATDNLTVGGYQSGADSVFGGTDDFVLGISSASTATPIASVLAYTSSKVRSYNFLSNDVTLALGAEAVPEPRTWTLMLIGLSGLGVIARATRRASLKAKVENR